MKRLLIIFFLCFAGNSYNSQAQNLEEIIHVIHGGLGGEEGVEELLDGASGLLNTIGDEINESAGLQFSSYVKCLYMMIVYSLEYEHHVKRINEATDCEEKYDLYGVLLMYIASSTAISYCPESLLDLLDNPEKRKEEEKFYAEIKFIENLGAYLGLYGTDGLGLYPDDNLIDKLYIDMILKISSIPFYLAHFDQEEGTMYNHRVTTRYAIASIIEEYFHPEAVINTTLETGEKMDALPCSPGSQHRRN